MIKMYTVIFSLISFILCISVANVSGQEVKVTLKGTVEQKWEKAEKGIDYKEEYGRVFKLTEDDVAYDTEKKSGEVLRTRVMVTKAISENGKDIANMRGKSLVVVGKKKAEVKKFANEEVELVGIIKDSYEIDVISVTELSISSEKVWTIKVLSVEKSNTIISYVGQTRMVCLPEVYGGNAFLTVTFQAGVVKSPAVLKFTKDSTYIEDEQGHKFAMQGKAYENGNYDPSVISFSKTESGIVKLVFPISGESKKYKLTLSNVFSPITLPDIKTTEK